MKIKKILSLIIGLLFFILAPSQSTLSPSQWDIAKENRKINGKEKASQKIAKKTPMEYRIAPNTPVHSSSSICQCWQTRDSSWSIVPVNGGIPPEYRNDDGSSSIVSIPFTFCLYGTNWNNCYINNNGNISFGSPYGTFTASGFPNASFIMVAPFWSDVDTRGIPSGLPYYKITPTYMVVQWDSVGYYNSYIDKLNTFQVIITNGSDLIVPGGNVSFCYKDMQWTTGDASGGINGFNGSDAIVGANSGDGVNYIQFGAFNQPGGNYNGPAGPNSGIDWLDNQTFLFDACASSNNVPPTPNGITICDTLRLCEGDSLPFNATFFSPEVAQSTTITIDTTGVTGFVIVTNTVGNTAVINSYFIGSTNNIGYNNIIITATDNGVPAGVTVIPIVIEVIASPIVIASNDTTICVGSIVNLNSNGGGTYSWLPATNLSNASIANPIATPTTTTTYFVTVSDGTCTTTEPVTINVQDAFAIAGPDTSICSGDNVVLNATGGITYAWTPTIGLSNPNIPNPIALPVTNTTYTCTVTTAIGCIDVATATVLVLPLPTSSFTYSPTVIFADSTYYFADQSTPNITGWFWDFGDGNNSLIQNPQHTYTAAGTYRVCLTTTNNLGCINIVCSDVIVLPYDVLLPNVFTPNGDGTNDFFVIKNLEFFPNSKIQIYDRWGALIYENGNYNNEWNGKKNGANTNCTDGTYYYVLSGPNIKKSITGFVQLIRGK